MEEIHKDNFSKMVDSLKMYRRYELIDSNNKDLLEQIYEDPIENNGILKLCMKDSTTVLIGRKGTGKSTILMQMQQQLRKSKEIMTCYIDVKTVYDTAKMKYSTISYLKNQNKTEVERYSIQRQFILEFIDELIKEIQKNYNSIIDVLKGKLNISKPKKAIESLKEIEERIKNNDHLTTIEMEAFQDVQMFDKDNSTTEENISGQLGVNIETKKTFLKAGVKAETQSKADIGQERKYNRVFAKIFEIDQIIEEIKCILQELSMKRLYLILDDYSEIDKYALELFCDLIVNTMNNNSDNFIKLKIAAYPGRVVLGELDRQKIDIRYLDYYQLYAGDKRNDMENSAIDFTKRLLERRLKVYTKQPFEFYFDTTKDTIDAYCEVIFNTTMNVIRHIGLLLDYAQEISIIKGQKITLTILNEAAKKVYKERMEPFFEEMKTAQMTYEERIEIIELSKLLNIIVEKEKTIKTDIVKNKYEAAIFDEHRTNPFVSHFYVAQELEPYLGTLELNFFVSKYNEMISKTKKKVSIYALNYGLCMNENLKWGKPKGNKYRTYFIESPFNFTPLFKNFLKNNKKIFCTKCGQEYTEEEYQIIKRYGGNCLQCQSNNSVIEQKVLTEEETKEVDEIDKTEGLLKREEYRFIKLLYFSKKSRMAGELAQELDLTYQKIGRIAKNLNEQYQYIEKNNIRGKIYYNLTENGKKYLSKVNKR